MATGSPADPREPELAQRERVQCERAQCELLTAIARLQRYSRRALARRRRAPPNQKAANCD